MTTPSIGKPYKRAADDRWVVHINLGTDATGKRRRTTIVRKKRADAIADAKTKLDNVEAGLITGDKTTVETWLNYWLDNIAARRGLSPNTLRSYRSQINNSIIPTIGNHQLQKLSPAHIRDMHTQLERRGRSISTAKQAHTILGRALDDAVPEGLLIKNPAKLVDNPTGDAALRPALTVDQARHLIATCIKHEDPMTFRWVFGLLTGSRQGEVIGLTWDRVDFTNNVVDLSMALVAAGQRHGCRTEDHAITCGHPGDEPQLCPQKEPNVPRGYSYIPLGGPLVLGRTKTRSSTRVIPLITPLAKALQDHKAAYPPGQHNLVWTNQRTGAPLHPTTDHRNWHKALERAGLPSIPLHSARHTAATLLMQMEVEEAVRMQLLGQSSQAVHRGYAHVDQSQTRAALDGYGKALGI